MQANSPPLQHARPLRATPRPPRTLVACVWAPRGAMPAPGAQQLEWRLLFATLNGPEPGAAANGALPDGAPARLAAAPPRCAHAAARARAELAAASEVVQLVVQGRYLVRTQPTLGPVGCGERAQRGCVQR